MKFPVELFRTCSRVGVVPTRYLLGVNIARQTTTLFERLPLTRDFQTVKTYRCSTSKYGIGELAGSNMTPRGLHRIAKKIGGGWPVGAVFKSREMVGYKWLGAPDGAITHRIFWLEGMEDGFNRGEGRDSFQRFIYIHGPGNEPNIGRPDSHGCVHLCSNDLMPLYDKLPEGTLVWIAEK